MKQPKNELLVDYLDEKLSPEERSEIENMVQQDTGTASDLEYLKLAIETVRLNAINKKVIAVRRSLNTTINEQAPKSHVIVRQMYRTGLRIAAILVLLFGSAALYKYISVSNQSVYKNQFIPYELSNMRGSEDHNPEADAYRNKNWNLVIELYGNDKIKSNKSNFLAAMAELQLSHYTQAEILFQNVLDSESKDSSFQEDAEYYCALTYLMDHRESKGIGMLNKIKADTSHRYYPLASGISGVDLKIIELKK
jgi:hypothetical protein